MKLYRILIVLLLSCRIVFANNLELISEMESLLPTLEKGDATRIELVKRLADIYFRESIQITNDNALKGVIEPTQQLKQFWNKSYGHYEEAASYTAEGNQKNIILFQQARLLEYLDKKKQASKVFENLIYDKNSSDLIKGESSFKLAEYYDDQYEDAKAEKFFKESLKYCKGELCIYNQFKLAWVYYRLRKIDLAIENMKSTLWSDGKIQEKSLRDYIVFLANRSNVSGEKEYREINEIAQKLNRPELLTSLGDTFYSTGNRVAGTYVLAQVNKSNSDINITARLAEEYYGFGNWEKFRQKLNLLKSYNQSSLPKNAVKAKSLKETVKRLALQLDGEFKSDPTKDKDLRNIIEIFLSFYPQDALKTKMIDGWITAQSDSLEKINKIPVFISMEIEKADEIRLRKVRLSLAQKAKNTAVILEESKALHSLVELKEDKRKFNYLYAHTLYNAKKVEEAQPIFVALAKVDSGEKPDKWAIQSQHLILDILNEKKDYAGIMSSAASWTSRQDLRAIKGVAKEISQMEKIATQAKFQKAFTLGQTKEALQVFEEFCYGGQFQEKSCANVKVLAVKLAVQPSIIKILKYFKDEKSLMIEYERMGKFSQAAKLQEKFNLKKNSPLEDFLRIGILYELDKNFKDRDRVLNRMIAKIKRDKKIDEKLEPLIYNTLVESGFFNYKLVSIPWTVSRKMRIVADLEERGAGSKLTKKLYHSSDKNLGAIWEEAKVLPLEKLEKAQAKIGFYGRYQKSRFKRRINALTKFAQSAKKILEITTPKSRVYIANKLVGAYEKLATEIEDMPISKLIEDQAQRDQIKQNLMGMAAPYRKEADGYQKIADEQLELITDIDEKDKVIAGKDLAIKAYFSQFKKSEFEDYKLVINDELSSGIDTQLKSLEVSPDNQTTLSSLKSLYEEAGNKRLAAYYQGRLMNLSKGQDL